MKQKENVNVEEAEVVEVENQVPAEEKQPRPETTNYDVVICTTDQFVNDLEISLGDIAYAQSKPFVQFATAAKEGFPIAKVNEFLKKIEMLPYRYVNQLMRNIESKEGREVYFVEKQVEKESEANA